MMMWTFCYRHRHSFGSECTVVVFTDSLEEATRMAEEAMFDQDVQLPHHKADYDEPEVEQCKGNAVVLDTGL